MSQSHPFNGRKPPAARVAVVGLILCSCLLQAVKVYPLTATSVVVVLFFLVAALAILSTVAVEENSPPIAFETNAGRVLVPEVVVVGVGPFQPEITKLAPEPYSSQPWVSSS